MSIDLVHEFGMTLDLPRHSAQLQLTPRRVSCCDTLHVIGQIRLSVDGLSSSDTSREFSLVLGGLIRVLS
jgi:hypothetical protein